MFNFLGKTRSARRASTSPAARSSYLQSRRRRLCGWEQLEERSMLAISVVSSPLDTNDPLGLANASSYSPATSADGRYVVFVSEASNLVPGDTNNNSDIFLKDTFTGALTMVSTDSAGNQGISYSYEAEISGDGRYVVFTSFASNLVSGDTNGTPDIFLKDTQTGITTRISTDSAGNQGNSYSYSPSISADGRYVVFQSLADNLVSGDTNGHVDIFFKDTQTGALTRISTDSSGNQANAHSEHPEVSADGRYVVFSSYANNLVTGDTNSHYDIFRKDVQTGAIIRVSTDSAENQANNHSYDSSISADGRYVAFTSYANNLVSGDTNGNPEVFLKDIQTGLTTRVSTDSSGNQGNYSSWGTSISADGRYVVFYSDSENLVSGDTNGTTDVFLKDTQTGLTTRLSTDAAGNQANGGSANIRISADGQFVVYTSNASNLVSNDLNNNNHDDIFRRELATGATTILSVTGVPGLIATANRDSFNYNNQSLSADGRYVVFTSGASNLIANDTNNRQDVFYKDNQTGGITLVSSDSAGTQGDSDSYRASISADGRYVVFWSYATNLVPDDTNGTTDIFLKDMQTGALTRVSTDSSGNQANSSSSEAAISGDGRYVVFQSDANNLVPDDTNNTSDIFLKDMQTGILTRVSTDSSENQANHYSSEPSISADGRYVVFRSDASNLVNNDTNFNSDIFLKDIQTGLLTRVSTNSSGNQTQGYSYVPAISADGRYVTFSTYANDLVSGDTDYDYDVFRKDVETGAIILVSADSNGVNGNSSSYRSAISGDGRYVAFESYATNLVSGDTNGIYDIFFKDTLTGEITRLSTDNSANQGNRESYWPSISENGRFVAFYSLANNLVSNDLNNAADVFLVDTQPATAPTVTSPTATNVTLTTATLGGNVTDDGGATITERGIVWSVTALNNNPQIGGTSVTQVTTAGTTGVFTIDVTALPTGTQISYAAYATNIAGTSYTTVGTFTTQPAIGQFPGITVQILGGQMIVTGTEQDDTIKVASDGMGGYIVTANKNINGLPSPQSFSGATSFVANTLGGHDDLWLTAPLTLDDVTVDLGNGNDRLVLGADPNNAINNNVLDPQFGTLGYLTVNGPVSVIGGEGNDRVIERSTNINGVKTINLGEGNNEYNVYWGFSNETIFSSGAGTDNVYIGYLSSREASQFDTGAGNDLISYYASRFYKTAYLNSGAGADTVALDVNIYDEATTVDTGSEADYLLFSRSVAYKSVVLTTAAGADTVLIGKYISGLGSNGSPIYSNGGSNIDELTLNTGVEADTVQVAANVMRMFFANLGDAYDDAEVEYNLFTDGFLDGGGQGMRLRLRGNAGLRTNNPG